jgi:UDP-galactopyranose mutase
MKKYDMILVGAGLTNATIAALNPDKNILIVEKSKIGGMCRTENTMGIDVHVYGPHIFHTSSKKAWDFVNKYAEFNGYVHSAKSIIDGKPLDFPINLSVYQHLYGFDTPSEIKEIIYENDNDNYEDYLREKIGNNLYELFYKHYTEKFWGMPATQVPTFIGKRVPVRTSFNNNYFDDRFQGAPIDGYSSMIERMISHCEVVYADFNANKDYFEPMSDVILHTGSIDEYFDYSLGELQYRSCEYINNLVETEDHQGVAQYNYPDKDVAFTRKIEHKHFNWVDLPYTIISTEYPLKWTPDGNVSRFYPIPTDENKQLYDKYASMDTKVKFLGRLGSYRYLNMDQCVLEAMSVCDKLQKV